MTDLITILANLNFSSSASVEGVSIKKICFDSREVEEGDVFVAVKGLQSDGHSYIDQVIAKGVKVVVCEEFVENENKEVVFIKVQNSAIALAKMASNYYNDPSSELKLVGITGTNGKTTTVSLLYDLFLKLGYKVGLISTIENRINGEVIPTKFTTPDVLTINSLLSQMVTKGCDFVFMEVSSHAIEQRRVTGLTFAGGIFSNITHEHLDYHKTFDAYIKAKKTFFDNLPKNAFALTNIDDKRGVVMLQNTKAKKHTYGLRSPADFKAKIVECSFEGLNLDVNGNQAWFRLIGDFNAYNILSVFAAAVLLGEKEEKVLTALSAIKPAKGRFDQVTLKNNITAIIDYAHTPDALENVLNTVNNIRKKNNTLITIVGCGGDRDAAKRPVMAKIAYDLSDRLIITSDNPRFEDPEKIIQDMLKGLKENEKQNTLIVPDRKEAINQALQLSKPNNIILVAGKGHEDYQEIKGIRHHFDDKEILIEQGG